MICSSDRLVGSPSHQCVEYLNKARFVRITHGGFAIWLDPFGMLDPQVVVNLLPKLGVRVGLGRHRNLADLECSFVISFSAVIALKWGGLAPRRHRFLRIVVGVSWLWCRMP